MGDESARSKKVASLDVIEYMSTDQYGRLHGRFEWEGKLYEFTALPSRRFRILRFGLDSPDAIIKTGETTRDDTLLRDWVPTDDSVPWNEPGGFGLAIEVEDADAPSGWRRTATHPAPASRVSV